MEGQDGGEGREEGYIAQRVSLRWFRPVLAPFPFSSHASPPSSLLFTLFFTLSLLLFVPLLFWSTFFRPSTSPLISHFAHVWIQSAVITLREWVIMCHMNYTEQLQFRKRFKNI